MKKGWHAEVRSAPERANAFGKTLAGMLAQESSIRRFLRRDPAMPTARASDPGKVA
jgi:hypothetical protein